MNTKNWFHDVNRDWKAERTLRFNLVVKSLGELNLLTKEEQLAIFRHAGNADDIKDIYEALSGESYRYIGTPQIVARLIYAFKMENLPCPEQRALEVVIKRRRAC